MWPQSLRRSSSGTSAASSYDSLEDFLSEFEVVSKEEPAQSGASSSLQGQNPLARNVPWAARPPRPSVRLSTHPYQPVRQGKKHQQSMHPSDAAFNGAQAGSGFGHGYQQMALLPIPEPEGAPPHPDAALPSKFPSTMQQRADLGHLSEHTSRHPQRHCRQGAAPVLEPRQTALSPSRAPLDTFAEQLQADLGGSLSPPPSPFQSQQLDPFHQAGITALSQPASTQPPAATSASARPLPPAAAGGPRPLMPYPAVAGPRNAPGQASEPPRTGAGRAEALGQSRQVLQQAPVTSPPAVPSREAGAVRPATAHMGGGSSIPKSPVPSTLRVSQQVLRKKPKDFESELLDRLLNTAAPSSFNTPPVAGQMAPSPAKPAFNAFHLPVSRALLVTVLIALMGVPLLLFMGGRLQAQHHLHHSQVHLGAVSALNASGEPLANAGDTPTAPGGYGLDNATGRQHLPMEGRYSGAAPPVDADPDPVEDHSAKHKRNQVGLKLLSLRVTLSVKEILHPNSESI